MKRKQPAQPKLTVIAHDVRSVLNVGSIFRTADAAGVGMLWLTGYTPGPDTHAEKIRKTALGSDASVPWARARRVGDVVRSLRARGVRVVALEQTRTSVDYRTFRPTFPMALIVGNEVKGVGSYTSHNVDAVIELPMRGAKESLNVAVALGVALYELTRRWK
jgi:tRNA G18 (ribose-2'-O)-methylase SpoU